MRTTVQRLSERFAAVKDVALLSAACLLGMAMATAAIGLAPRSAIDPGLKTLAQAGENWTALAAPGSLDCRHISVAKRVATTGGRIGRIVCEE